jgi:hypothetical protein
MSNSLSAVNSNVNTAKSNQVDHLNDEQTFHIKALNKLLGSEEDENENLIDQLKDSWYTKEELKQI